MTPTPHVPEPYTPKQAVYRLDAVCGELEQRQVASEVVAELRGVCRQPGMADLVPELERIYQALRDPVWFQDHQQRLLERLRRNWRPYDPDR